MAGSPTKRAKREALKQAAAQLPQVAPAPLPPPTPPAGIVDATRARDARAHARTRPQPPTQTRAPAMGRTTHAAIDEQQANTVRTLAHYIKPGLMLRLSRTRPTWAMGYIEDYPVNEGESLNAFYEYVRDTHGGQTYRVEVLGAGDVQMFEGGLTIAGPVRVDGRVVTRAKFEGRDDENERSARPATTKPDAGDSTLLALLTMLMDSQRESRDAQRESNAAQLATVTGLVAETRKQTGDLMQVVLQTRDDKRNDNDLGTQLGRIVDAVRSVDKVKKVLGGGDGSRRTNANDAPPQTDLDLAETSLKKVLFEAVASKLVRDPPGAAQPARPAPNGGQPPPQTRPNPRGSIPDARSAGQGHAKN